MPILPNRKILGLVDASTAGGIPSPPPEWSLVFHLAAWRYPDSASATTESRRCEMPVSQAGLRSLMQEVRPYGILEVEVAEDSGKVLRLSRIMQIGIDDPELSRIAAELQKPILISHPDLGELQYSRAYHWYEGHVLWNGQDVEFRLDSPDPANPTAPLEIASQLLQDLSDWNRRAMDHAADRLLDLQNTEWANEDEEGNPIVLSREEFLSRLTLQSISVYQTGGFSLWYDDEDMFEDHIIEARGNLETGLTEVGIA